MHRGCDSVPSRLQAFFDLLYAPYKTMLAQAETIVADFLACESRYGCDNTDYFESDYDYSPRSDSTPPSSNGGLPLPPSNSPDANAPVAVSPDDYETPSVISSGGAPTGSRGTRQGPPAAGVGSGTVSRDDSQSGSTSSSTSGSSGGGSETVAQSSSGAHSALLMGAALALCAALCAAAAI